MNVTLPSISSSRHSAVTPKSRKKRRHVSLSPNEPYSPCIKKVKCSDNLEPIVIDDRLTPPRTPTDFEQTRILSSGPLAAGNHHLGNLNPPVQLSLPDPLEPSSYGSSSDLSREPASSTCLENSLLYDEAVKEIETEDENSYNVIFLPSDGKYYHSTLRSYVPLEKPLAGTIHGLVEENITESRDKTVSAQLSKNEFILKSAIESITDFLGSPLAAMDIITAEGCLVYKDLGITSQSKLRTWQATNAKKSIAIKDSLKVLSKGKTWDESILPQKPAWLGYCHILASNGTKIIGALNQAGRSLIMKMTSTHLRNEEMHRLDRLVKSLQGLAEIYASARRLTELYLVDAKDLVFTIPLCDSLLMWALVKNDIISKLFPDKESFTIPQIPTMVELRLREVGCRVHTNRSGRKILGTAPNFKSTPEDRPIIGIARDVSYFISGDQDYDLCSKLVNTSLLRYGCIEPDDIPLMLDSPNKNLKMYLDELLKATLKSSSFLDKFLVRNVSFGKHGCFTNRIFSAPRNKTITAFFQKAPSLEQKSC